MKSKIVPVKNVARLSAAARALLTRAPGAPGIGLVDGQAGYGKSTATAWLSNQVPSIYVRATAMWTPSAMLGAILRELRQPSGGSCASMVERAVEALSLSGQVLFLDEVDYIVRKTVLIETLRDIHDLATTPVIIIGEEEVAQKIAHLKRFSSRIAQRVSFEPLDMADASLLASELCDVEIKPDLLEHIHRLTKGNARNIVVSLARAEQLAKSGGKRSLALADVGKKSLFTGTTTGAEAIPSPLRVVAGGEAAVVNG